MSASYASEAIAQTGERVPKKTAKRLRILHINLQPTHNKLKLPAAL